MSKPRSHPNCILTRLMIAVAFVLAVCAAVSIGCSGLIGEPVRGSTVKVAKVDTEYVYEANVAKYVEDFRASRRARISTFIGFSPDDILRARENAIDSEIRKEIKRLPGVHISGQEVRALANEQVEELAWRLYGRLTEGGEDFAALAIECSAGPTAREGGAVQAFGEVENPEEYQTRAYSMGSGELSEPFSAWDGWRIVRLDDVTEDPLAGRMYHVSMILLKTDISAAEATIIGEIAERHTIEVLDPKYNSRRALEEGDFQGALEAAAEALRRSDEDDLAYYLRARALWGLDRHAEALEELELAAECGRISDALIPYYHFYRGEYLEELERIEEALEAYRESYENWQQDVSIAFGLKEKFEELGDEEHAALLAEEIEAIAQQDIVALLYRRGAAPGGVIHTGEGEVRSGSAEYEPGYQE